MAIYTGIGGSAKSVSKIYIGVGGTEGRCTRAISAWTA